jgi:hypothetical protein
MLITSFAAGELSENLFGRTDLPQYYSGVSRLENFDVIPTGGIDRRNGLARLRKMGGEGRIIPFIVDRERHYLLYLMPGKIQVYLEKDLVSEVTSVDNISLYPNMGVIHEVQYAQNANMMILAHKSRKPVVLTLNQWNLAYGNFNIDISIDVSVTGNFSSGEHDEPDSIYEAEGYLRTAGNFPGCVSFMRGRLVFAGTEKNPQRLFFSSQKSIYNFSTYKKFVTEQRNYVTLVGVVSINSNQVVLDSILELSKLTGDYRKYIYDGPLFAAGTVILNIAGNALYLSNNAEIAGVLTDAERGQLDAWRQGKADLDDNPTVIELGGTGSTGIGSSSGWEGDPYFRIRIGSTYIIAEAYGTAMSFNRSQTFPMDKDIGKDIELNNGYARQYFIDTIIPLFDEWANEYAHQNSGPYYAKIKNNDALLDQVAGQIKSNIGTAFYYIFKNIAYNDTPQNIYQTILGAYIADGMNVNLSFYTRSVIIDRYPTPDDGFTFEIASDMSDAIRWIGQNKSLLAGTETAEWIIPAGVNATDVQAILNSRYGSDKIQSTAIGDAVCFIQSGRRALVEYYIPQQDNNFRANNMAMLSQNMLHESPAHDIDFISAPYTKIFVSREDGILVSLLYERSSGTFAWGRIITSGKIKSVATLPGETGYDEVYLIVERSGGHYLERLDERRKVYLDSYEPWAGDNADYSAEAIVFDGKTGKVYGKTEAPAPGADMWVGYSYASLVRSMPVLANDRMKQNNIKSLQTRFLDSYMPRVKSLPNGVVNSIPREEPYSGVAQIPFPGVFDRDVFFEFIHDKPTRCRILAVNAEAN